LTFRQRKVKSPNASGLACAIDSWHRGLLKLIDSDNTGAHLAAKQDGQLDIGNQIESASEVVAGFFPYFAAPPQRHRR
jgi:hypothetical protein